MGKQRYWIVGAGVVMAGLVVLCLYLSRAGKPEPGVTWANVRRIEVGMTEPEVQAVVGRPPQARLRGPRRITDNSPPVYETSLLWSDMECDILVYLDQDGRVIGRQGVGRRSASWYDRLLRQLGL